MTRRLLTIMGLFFVTASCSQNAGNTPTSLAATTVPAESVTTTPMSTNAPPASADVPRLGSTLEEPFPLPIRVVESAVLNVAGSCVTAATADKTILLVFDLRAVSVLGAEIHFEDLYPDTPTLVLSSGARYQLRGIPDPFEVELAEPVSPGCVYDERMLLLGVLDVPVGHGLTTRPVDVIEAVGSIGINSTTITIEGACTTIIHPIGELLVIWPEGTVSLLDDHTIHMSRWEAIFTEVVIGSGDTVMLFGADSDRPLDNPPPDCEYDGTFYAEVVRPAPG